MINTMTRTSFLFLIDGIGALISILLLGFILPLWSNFLGVSPIDLSVLASIACVLALYSCACFVGKVQNKAFLKIVAIANISYCLLTFIWLWYMPQITLWGILYFVGEIVVIMTLATIEWKYSF
jgi:hypothetical protein